MSNTSTARAYLGAGLVTLNIWDTVTLSYPGFGDPLDADKFEIKPNSEEKTSESRSHKDFGQARAAVVLAKPTEINIEIAAASVEVLAIQFQGLVKALTQAEDSQAATDFTVAKLDRWLPLGHRNIKGTGFVVTNADATVTYVQGVDYQVNWLRGEIRFLSSSLNSPDKDDTVKVACAWGAVDGKKILGGKVTQIRCQARFDGVNMVDGSPMEADVYEAVLGTDSGFDFLASDFQPITLKGKVVTPFGMDDPYEVRCPGAAAG